MRVCIQNPFIFKNNTKFLAAVTLAGKTNYIGTYNNPCEAEFAINKWLSKQKIIKPLTTKVTYSGI